MTTLEGFAAKCHDLLKSEPGPAGREKVRALLETALRSDRFVTSCLDDKTPERQILYEDPQLRFCILAHSYQGAKTSPPHDHGPSWAIYGQARGVTEMSDYQLLEPASADVPGKVKKVRTYTLTPGIAHVYNEADLHSPSRAGPTRLIRIEGVNMEKVKRLKFQAV